jgi:hypothetical protein
MRCDWSEFKLGREKPGGIGQLPERETGAELDFTRESSLRWEMFWQQPQQGSMEAEVVPHRAGLPSSTTTTLKFRNSCRAKAESVSRSDSGRPQLGMTTVVVGLPFMGLSAPSA